MAQNEISGTATSYSTSPPSPATLTTPPAPAAARAIREDKEHREHRAPEHSDSSIVVWVVLILVAVGAGVGFVLYKRHQKPATRTPPPVTISTTNAWKGNMDVTVSGLGTVTPIYTAAISPRVDGQLVKVSYTEGQMVTPKDLLVEIDPRPYQAQLVQAQGQLARDQAMLEGANVDLKRFSEAYAKTIGSNVLHAIPKQSVDDQLALVHQDEGAVKLDEGNVSNAQVQVDYCDVHAPIEGRVGLRLVDPGNVVHAANTNPMVVVTQLKPITVIFGIDQQFLPAIQDQLRAGHKMTVQAWNKDESKLVATGEFLTMDNLIDLSTGNIRIKAQFANDDMSLFPNQFVWAKLIIDTQSNVTLIPTPSVQRNPQGAFVYVVGQDSTLKMTDVTVGIQEADISAVTGIEPGETIASDNFNKLGDNMKVNVRQPGEAGSKGGKGPPADGQAHKRHGGDGQLGTGKDKDKAKSHANKSQDDGQ